MKKSLKKGNNWIFIVFVACLAMVAGFNADFAQAASDSLVVAVPSIGNTLDASVANFTFTTMAVDHIYDRIIAFDENFDFVPAVATDWEYVDNVTFKFTVGDGFVFHNGDALTMEDVVYSIERLREIPRAAAFMDNIKSTEITGENEITIKLVEADSSTLRSLFADAHVYNKAYTESSGGSYATKPVGTGPYKVDRFIPGDRLELVAWEDYPFEKPAIKKISFKTIEEDANRYITIETGEAQFAVINHYDVPRALQNRKIDVITQETTNTSFISMNTQKPPFNNPNVRLAMAYAVDKESLAIVQGGAKVIHSMVPSMFSSYHEPAHLPRFDLAKAQQLLEAEGYNASNPLKFEAWTYGGNSTIMEIYQALLKSIGVEMSIKNLEFGVFLEGMANGEYEMLSGSWNNTTGDPLTALENYWTGSFGSHNISFFENERCDELYNIAKTATDEGVLIEAAREMQEIAASEMPIIPTFSNQAIYAVHSGLKGVKYYPTNIFSFRNAYFE